MADSREMVFRTLAGRKLMGEALESNAATLVRCVEKLLPPVRKCHRIFVVEDCEGALGRIIPASGNGKAVALASVSPREGGSDAWQQMLAADITRGEAVVALDPEGGSGFAAKAVRDARRNGMVTVAVSCSPSSPTIHCAEYPVALTFDPQSDMDEAMRVEACCMAVDVLLCSIVSSLEETAAGTSGKPQEDQMLQRACEALMQQTGIEDARYAASLILQYGSVRRAVKEYNKKNNG
ncbi:MAG: hypothetical protein HUJ91_00105 [Bacteroidales bacterium]|nr:hypothetical protein [Bacteroidales bacterium]